jgi:hypothetical protein
MIRIIGAAQKEGWPEKEPAQLNENGGDRIALNEQDVSLRVRRSRHFD